MWGQKRAAVPACPCAPQRDAPGLAEHPTRAAVSPLTVLLGHGTPWHARHRELPRGRDGGTGPGADLSAPSGWRRDSGGTPRSRGAPAYPDASPKPAPCPNTDLRVHRCSKCQHRQHRPPPGATANRGVPAPVIPQWWGSAEDPAQGLSPACRSMWGLARSRSWSRSSARPCGSGAGLVPGSGPAGAGSPAPPAPCRPCPGSTARRARPMGGGAAGTRRAQPRSRRPPRAAGVGGRSAAAPPPTPKRRGRQ